MTIRLLVGFLGALCLVGNASATTLTLSGFLDDPGNSALVASDLGPALFGDDLDIANNVALYAFNLSDVATVTFESLGFAAGGADPYFTLFRGGDTTATFLESNFAQAFSTGGDFVLSFVLPADSYMIAIGAFANMSSAENLGAGTLADGFIALGQPTFLGDAYYELLVTTVDGGGDPTPVPEPGALALVAIGLVALRVLMARQPRTSAPG